MCDIFGNEIYGVYNHMCSNTTLRRDFQEIMKKKKKNPLNTNKNKQENMFQTVFII